VCPSISTVFNNIEVTTAEGHINFIVHTRRPDPTRPDPIRPDNVTIIIIIFFFTV